MAMSISTQANPVFAFLDGKQYVLDGMSGVFKHTFIERPDLSVDGRRWFAESLDFMPDECGRQTEQYRETKQWLGDDWVVDMSDSIDQYCTIAQELGYEEASRAETV
jgi:hypothetical protein